MNIGMPFITLVLSSCAANAINQLDDVRKIPFGQTMTMVNLYARSVHPFLFPPNSVISGIMEAKMEELPEIIHTLKEMREVCAACFRVIYFADGGVDYLINGMEVEFKRLGIDNGFGKRCQDLIEKLEQKGP
jgi:hypothetical protein